MAIEPDPTWNAVRLFGNLPRLILMAGSIAVLLLLLLIVNVNRPPFPLERMDRLSVGMSMAEVRTVLGDPTSNSGGSWAYSGALSWPIVYVHFDANGRYESWHYDF